MTFLALHTEMQQVSAHISNLSAWEAEVGGSSSGPGSPLHSRHHMAQPNSLSWSISVFFLATHPDQAMQKPRLFQEALLTV